jgi:Uma2 family endonuclease
MAIAQRMTLEEFLQLPEEKPALEYIDGEVVQKVSPKADHGWFQLQIGSWINQFAVPRKLAAAFTETRTTYEKRSTVPDVSVYRWDRIPRDAEGVVQPDLLIPPDIAIEIASPGQSRRSLLARCQWFVESGVEIALLVDYRDRSITGCRAGEPLRVYRGEERVDLDSVLPGFELTPRALFDSLRLV